MAKRPGKQIAEAPAEPLTKGGEAAEKIVKGNAEALTVSGNASRAACHQAHEEIRRREAARPVAGAPGCPKVRSSSIHDRCAVRFERLQ